jgi:hypothetical protein
MSPRTTPLMLLPLLLLLLTTLACGDPGFEGELHQPIPIRVDEGIPLIEVLFDQSSATAAIDSGSPLVVVAHELSGARRTGELRLQDGRHPEVTRFLFHEQEVFDLPVARLGLGAPVAVQALLGAALLSRFSVNLDYRNAVLILRDSIPDSARELAEDCVVDEVRAGEPGDLRCAAVVGASRAGGGTIEVGGDIVELAGYRMVVPLCLQPAPFDPPTARRDAIEASGQPATAVVYTGLGQSVISRSAFDRLRVRYPDLAETPGATLHLPYGSEPVSTTRIDRLAIVSDQTADLAACRELARRRRLLLAPAQGLDERDEDEHGASAAVISGAIPFVILADESPLLSGLRAELRSLFAGVDVLLGGSALESFSIDLDYPAGRVILRCNDDGARHCRVMPFCARDEDDGPHCR